MVKSDQKKQSFLTKKLSRFENYRTENENRDLESSVSFNESYPSVPERNVSDITLLGIIALLFFFQGLY